MSTERFARALALLVALGGARGAPAVPTPCTDVPGTEALACRAAELVETTATLGPPLAAAGNQAARDAAAIADACAGGGTRRAQRGLRRIRKRLDEVRDVLADPTLVPMGRTATRPVGPLLELLDALRRATMSRLRAHPCPELVEVLSPRPEESVAEADSVRLVFTLAPGIASGGVTAGVARAGRRRETPVTLAQPSGTQGWAEIPCPGPGRWDVVVHVAADDGRSDTERVPFRCGDPAATLGARIEVLIDEDVAGGLRLVPVRPLRSGATYAAVVTSRLRGRHGRPVVASAAFREAIGGHGRPRRGGIEAHWSAALDDPANPFPDNRLRTSGGIAVPDGFSARGVPADARLDGVRAFLRGLDALDGEHSGFSASTAIVLRLGEPVKLEKTTPDRVFLAEVPAPDTDLAAGDPAALLPRLRDALGRGAERIAVATVFTVEDLDAEIAQIRAGVAARAAEAPPVVSYVDPDPNDARIFGVFHPGDPEFASFFGGTPPASAGVVARGSFPSPDYRQSGRFPPEYVSGAVAPPEVSIDFLLVLPAGPAPAGGFPTVILQHGFGGDNGFVAEKAADFAAAGLAVIGIPAPEHGPRGNPIDFFDFDDFNAFGNNFRQASVDLFQLAQVVSRGLDLDGATASELRPSPIGYLGVSLGGVIGATFCAAEPLVGACVLNVPGGKLAQFAGSVSSLASSFLTRFAKAAGIPAQTCDGVATASACTSDAECAGAPCAFNDDFVLLLDAALPAFQWQLDPGDGINYVRRLRLEPRGPLPVPVLMQEGIGDEVVANPLTEALARGAGLPVQAPDASPGGTAGLWRFPPPAGHSIFSLLPEVRAQAVGFLTSDGTTLPAP